MTVSLRAVTYASPQPWVPSSLSTRQSSRSFELLVPRMKLSMRAIFMGGLRCADDRRDIGRLTRLMKAASLSATRGVRGWEEADVDACGLWFCPRLAGVGCGGGAGRGADRRQEAEDRCHLRL